MDATNRKIMPVKTFASREVQSHFGAVLDAAKREPVTVTQYGRPVVVMMGVEVAEEAQRALAGRRMSEFLRRLPRVEAAEALSDADINAMVHELR
jgi:prevent-host-death family protein